jgi:hypothetical protein
MTRVKVKTIKNDDFSAVFGQLFGDGKDMDFDIAMDKLNKLRSNLSRVINFLESFDKSIYCKVLNEDKDSPNRKHTAEFIADCKIISEWSEFGKNPAEVGKFYKKAKDNKVVGDCISMCKRLIKHKKHLEGDLSGNFLVSSNTKDLQVFPFCDFDIKYLYVYSNVDESVKKYILVFLSMLLKTTKEIYDVITSPDIDIDKISQVVVDVISSTKKMLPRCSKAFSRLESSMDLLKKNFTEYYKDFVSSKDQSTFITNFIADCTKEEAERTDGSSDIELTRQFMEITNFFRKQSAGKIKDPAIAQLLDVLDNQFKSVGLDTEE